MPIGFQQQVQLNPASGIEGDFASSNPFFTALAGPQQFVAGPNGLYAGRFAWANPITGQVTNAYQASSKLGFVLRSNSQSITQFGAQASTFILPGAAVTVATAGDFWGRFSGGAAVGQAVYASNLDGSLRAGASGAPTAGATATVATVGAQFTASIAVSATPGTGTMTVSAITSGTINVGTQLYNAAGQFLGSVTSLGTGSGGTGTYGVTLDAVVASTTFYGYNNLLTLSGSITGTFVIGQSVSIAGITANTDIASQVSGTTGGAGVYTTTGLPQFVAPGAGTSYADTQTNFFVASVPSADGLAKITISG